MGANATGVSARVQSIPKALLDKALPDIEPALRRLTAGLTVPILAATAVFLTLATMIAPVLWTDRGERRAAELAETVNRIELLAGLASHEIARLAGLDRPTIAHLQALAKALPPGSLSGGRHILLADEHGALIGGLPAWTGPARSLGDALGEAQPLTDLAGRDGVSTSVRADGTQVVTTVRALRFGHLAVMQPQERSRYAGFLPGHADLVLAIVMALGIGGLGLGWNRQARRDRRSAEAAGRWRDRVDTSLTRGRCGLWDWDVGRGRILWSASMFELLGYEPRAAHLSFGELNAIIHPVDCDLYGLARRMAASPTRPLDHVFRARTAGGSWMWLRVKAETIEDSRDGGRHIVGIAVDVTDEQNALDRNAAADMRLRDAIEAIPEAFVLWDENSRLVLCNSRFQALHGLPADLVQPGTTYAEIRAAGGRPRLDEQAALAASGQEGARTLDAQLPDGRWLHINERRTRDGGFVSVGTDITELKRHEGKLLASERRLLALVKAAKQSRQAAQLRAQQLAELAELYHEQKSEAESANRAKTEFLAKMSHELRTPLNAIIGFAEMMQQQIMGPLGCTKYVEYVEDIRGSGVTLLGKIDDIMRLSKIESGRFCLTPGPVELAEVVRGALAAVGREALSRGLTLSCDLAPTPVLEADGPALHQVLVQLLQNAVKSTGRGGTVRVRVRPAGRAVNLFIEDDGIGMPRAFLSRLGTPFEQVETEYHRSEKGFGLGLPLAKALIELHEGCLRIRSQEGVGTVVLVHLPLERLAEDDEADRFPEVFLQAAE